MEQAKLMGDKQAESDAVACDNGQPINPADAYKYNIQGAGIMKFGAKAAAANGQQPVVDAAAPNIDTPEQIEANNKPFVKQLRAQMIGDQISQDMNPVFKVIAPHLIGNTKQDIKAAGKKIGFTNSQINEIDPAEIPQVASVWGQAAKGVVEGFPGWKGTGLGADIAGNTPSDQNTFHNVPGAIGQMAEGLGGLLSLGFTVATGTEAIESAGVAPTAAEKVANFGVMATQGYNDAYAKSAEVLGDKPADEWKYLCWRVQCRPVAGSESNGKNRERN